ncbi:MAG: large conductance mechanosensitive channel protein MscL [Patescibacteria group bacterium]|nr:large conductance mechanosensitive channel protein MscL [Patescibacteria group bacterium]
MLKGFRQFILRGNVVDLAVGVMIGAAFNSVVQSLVKDILTPIVGALVKTPDFSSIAFTVNGSKFAYGDFLNNLISFVITAIAVYFFVVLPINTLHERFARKQAPPAPTEKKCPDCASNIPIDAKRCPQCTSWIDSPGKHA